MAISIFFPCIVVFQAVSVHADNSPQTESLGSPPILLSFLVIAIAGKIAA